MQTEILNLEPTDVLVVRTTAYMHQGQRDNIVADIKAQLGADAKVIVLDGGLDLQVLRPASVADVQEDPAPAAPARILNEEVAREYEQYRRSGAAPEQVAVVEMLRKEFDSADREKRAGRGRLQYVIERAEELDAQDAALGEVLASEPAVLPAYTWVHASDLMEGQAGFAVSYDDKQNRYAILNENLTDHQRTTYGVVR